MPDPGIKKILTILDPCVGNAEVAEQTVTVGEGRKRRLLRVRIQETFIIFLDNLAIN